MMMLVINAAERDKSNVSDIIEKRSISVGLASSTESGTNSQRTFSQRTFSQQTFSQRTVSQSTFSQHLQGVHLANFHKIFWLFTIFVLLSIRSTFKNPSVFNSYIRICKLYYNR